MFLGIASTEFLRTKQRPSYHVLDLSSQHLPHVVFLRMAQNEHTTRLRRKGSLSWSFSVTIIKYLTPGDLYIVKPGLTHGSGGMALAQCLVRVYFRIIKWLRASHGKTE